MSVRIAPLALLAALAATPSPAGTPNASEHQDLIFYHDDRPIFLRLHILVDGRGFDTVWREAVGRLYKYLDADGDGRVSAAEQGRAELLWRIGETALERTARRQGGEMTGSRGPNSGPKPSSGFASVDDLVSYLRPSLGPFQIRINGRNQEAELLLPGLDRNGDKSLSREEVEAAAASLGSLDVNDDETIQLQEIQPYQNPFFGASRNFNRAATGAADSPFAVIAPSDSRTGIVCGLLSRYDRPEKDNGLSQAELGTDPAVFSQADGDGDGRLDTDELVHYLGDIAPDLEVEVRVSRNGATEVRLLEIRGKPSPLAARVHATASGGLELVFDTVHVELGTGSLGRQLNVRQIFQNQFKRAAGDKKYLEISEGQRAGLFGAATLKLMDRDGDGKLFEEEMNDFIDHDSDDAESRTLLSVTDFGRSLFGALDTNGDRRLSARELRTVSSKIASWDRDGNGKVSAEEVPRNYRLVFGRGQSRLLLRNGIALPEIEAVAGPAPTQGPPWFVKMDRNRDGDLSRREFLGTVADFRRIDADHNGLIDSSEAAKR